MGTLPSKESHEYPGSFHFAQSGSHAMAIIPLTEHFFPSADSLAFRQLHACRDLQSVKYNFSLMQTEYLSQRHRQIKEWQASASSADAAGGGGRRPYLIVDGDADDGAATTAERASDEWVGIRDIGDDNFDDYFHRDTFCRSPRASAASELPRGVEMPCDEIRVPAPESHWRMHDSVKQWVNAFYPSQKDAEDADGATEPMRLRCNEAALEAYWCRSPASLYSTLVEVPNRGVLVDTNREMCSLYAQEQQWNAARSVVRAYKRQQKQSCSAADRTTTTVAAAATADPAAAPATERVISKEEADTAAAVPPPRFFLRPVSQVVIVRIHEEEENAMRAAYFASLKEGGSSEDEGEKEALLDDVRTTSSEPSPSLHHRRNGSIASQVDVASTTTSAPASRSRRTLSATRRTYRFESNDAYKDGRIHLVEEDGVLYLFAYNTAYVEPSCSSSPSAKILRRDDEGKQTSTARDGGSKQAAFADRKEAVVPPPSAASAAHGDEKAGRPAISITTAASAETHDDQHHVEGNSPIRRAFTSVPNEAAPEEHSSPLGQNSRQTSSFYRTTSSFSNGDEEHHQQQQQQHSSDASVTAAGVADGSGAALEPSSQSPAEEDEGDFSSGSLPLRHSHTVSDISSREDTRTVKQLELDSLARFILPICPVRVVGCNGYAESECRGTPWLRGYEDDPEEDAFIEQLPNRPPVMHNCGFIDASIGDKILSRAFFLGFQVYRNVCLDAGLPDSLVRPCWAFGLMSNIPLLQLSRELQFRYRAAAAEVELGYSGLRELIKGTENDLKSYIYSSADIPAVVQAEMELRETREMTDGGANTSDAGPNDDGLQPSKDSLPSDGSSSRRKVIAEVPTRASQPNSHPALIFPRHDSEHSIMSTIRGNRILSRVRAEAARVFFALIAEATAPVSASLFMEPLDLNAYDYGGSVRLHSLPSQHSDAEAAQVLPPPRNLGELLENAEQRRTVSRQRRAQRRKTASAVDEAAAAAEEVEEEGKANHLASPPYLVYVVVNTASDAAGPTRRVAEEVDPRSFLSSDSDDEAEVEEDKAVEAPTTSAPHQYIYPAGSFVDGELVVYNLWAGKWQPFEPLHRLINERNIKRKAREAQAMPLDQEERSSAVVKEAQDSDAAAAPEKQALVAKENYEICLQDILLCWIKRRLQSATLRNRMDPGWLRDSDGHIMQEGRYWIWSFKHDEQLFCYGLIPKFSKEKKKAKRSATAAAAAAAAAATAGALTPPPSVSTALSSPTAMSSSGQANPCLNATLGSGVESSSSNRQKEEPLETSKTSRNSGSRQPQRSSAKHRDAERAIVTPTSATPPYPHQPPPPPAPSKGGYEMEPRRGEDHCSQNGYTGPRSLQPVEHRSASHRAKVAPMASQHIPQPRNAQSQQQKQKQQQPPQRKHCTGSPQPYSSPPPHQMPMMQGDYMHCGDVNSTSNGSGNWGQHPSSAAPTRPDQPSSAPPPAAWHDDPSYHSSTMTTEGSLALSTPGTERGPRRQGPPAWTDPPLHPQSPEMYDTYSCSSRQPPQSQPPFSSAYSSPTSSISYPRHAVSSPPPPPPPPAVPPSAEELEDAGQLHVNSKRSSGAHANPMYHYQPQQLPQQQQFRDMNSGANPMAHTGSHASSQNHYQRQQSPYNYISSAREGSVGSTSMGGSPARRQHQQSMPGVPHNVYQHSPLSHQLTGADAGLVPPQEPQQQQPHRPHVYEATMVYSNSMLPSSGWIPTSPLTQQQQQQQQYSSPPSMSSSPYNRASPQGTMAAAPPSAFPSYPPPQQQQQPQQPQQHRPSGATLPTVYMTYGVGQPPVASPPSRSSGSLHSGVQPYASPQHPSSLTPTPTTATVPPPARKKQQRHPVAVTIPSHTNPPPSYASRNGEMNGDDYYEHPEANESLPRYAHNPYKP